MTATPVLHITRGLGIYVINSSKAFRRREVPGCLHACSQLNAKQLEAKVHPKCIPLCCRPPLSKLCEDELLLSSPVLGDSQPVAQGQLAICAPLQGGAHSCEHIFSHLMHHMWKEEAGIPSWPHCAHGHRGAKPHTQKLVQWSSHRFFCWFPFRLPKVLFLFSMFYKALHTPTFSYK